MQAISSLSVMLPALVGLFRWRELDKGLRIFWAMFILALAFEGFEWAATLPKAFAYAPLHLWTWVETACFLSVYYLWCNDGRILFAMTAFVFGSVGMKLMGEGFSGFDSGSFALSCVAVLYGTWVCFSVSRRELEMDWTRVWVFTGAILYFVGTCMLFLSFEFLDRKVLLWNGTSTFNIAANVLYARAIYVHISAGRDGPVYRRGVPGLRLRSPYLKKGDGSDGANYENDT